MTLKQVGWTGVVTLSVVMLSLSLVIPVIAITSLIAMQVGVILGTMLVYKPSTDGTASSPREKWNYSDASSVEDEH